MCQDAPSVIRLLIVYAWNNPARSPDVMHVKSKRVRDGRANRLSHIWPLSQVRPLPLSSRTKNSFAFFRSPGIFCPAAVIYQLATV
jgi:hypothetical protein